MPILEQDVVLVKSLVPADVPEGGGAATGEVIVDNQSNNLFTDISELNRILGAVSLRLAYLGVRTPDTDIYFGARVIVGTPPSDPRVSALLFQPSAFDRRTDMQRRIEGYLSRGPRWPGYLFDNHIAGQRAITLLQRESAALPAVGETLLIVGNEGLGTEYQQYVRVTKVSSIKRDFTVSDGSGPRNFSRAVVTCEISDPLERDFLGVEATDLDSGAPFAGKATVRSAVVADAGQYFGASPLALPAVLGDIGVRATSIYSALVPSAQTETPIADARPNQSIAGAVAPAGNGAVAFDSSALFDATHAIYVGGSILPGSLTITGAASLTDRAGVLLDASSAQVGAIDYVNGVITAVGSASYPGAKHIQYRLGADPGSASQSMSIPVTAGSRGSAWAFVLNPLPAAASLRVSFLSGGRWYVLSDLGDGALRGADAAYGAGQLNRTTGSVVVTLGALPDVGSKIIVQWAPTSTVAGAVPGTTRAFFQVQLGRPVSPGSVTITWNDGTARSVTDSAGILSGDGTGSIDYQAGIFRLSPDILPAPSTVFTVALTDAAAGSSGPITLTDTGSALTGSLSPGVAVGSLALNVTIGHTFADELYAKPTSSSYALFDEAGQIKAAMGDGTHSGPIGTINYVTGEISITKTLPNFVSRPFQHYQVILGANGDGSARALRAGAYVSEICTGEVSPNGATARYTTGTGAGGSATYACGQLQIQDAAIAPLDSRMSNAPVGYVTKNFMGRIGANRLVNRANQSDVYLNPPVSTADWSGPAGALGIGGLRLWVWPAGESSTVQIEAASGTYGGLSVDRAVFRFPAAPLRPGSVTVSAETIGGASINATADAAGAINTADMVGSVDYATGIVEVVFKTQQGTDTSPWAFDASALGLAGGGKVKVGHVKADSVRVAGVSYTYLPLPSGIVGLNAVRLPSNGLVPIFRPGNVAVVHHTASTAPANVSNGQTLSVGRGRLARLRVIGNDGAVIGTGYTPDLDAGTVTFTAVTGYAQPVTVEHVIKDEVPVADAQINGHITLTRPLTHDFPLGSIVSSALVIGDLAARVPLLFDQQTWTGEWSDDRIGAALSAQYNEIQYPITLTNLGAVTERWAIRFKNTTSFELLGEHLGFIAEGDVTHDFAPINPAVGQPYLTLRAAGWGGGWPQGGVLRINTVGALHPIGIARTIQQGDATLQDDKFTLMILGDRDRT